MYSYSQVKRPIRIYAHRGANLVYPENTIPAFAQALEEGATHLELDLHLSQDKQIVVIHDADARRLAGIDRKVRECELQEIQSWNLLETFLRRKQETEAGETKQGLGKLKEIIRPSQVTKFHVPTLAELLETFPKSSINADLKDPAPDTVTEIVQFIHQHKAEKRILLNSFAPRALAHLQRIPYRGKTGISRGSIACLRFWPPFLWRKLKIAGDALQIPPAWKGIRLDHPFFIHRCHALGKRVDYWTINEPEEALRLLNFGADGIISDNVGAVRNAVIEFASCNHLKLDYE